MEPPANYDPTHLREQCCREDGLHQRGLVHDHRDGVKHTPPRGIRLVRLPLETELEALVDSCACIQYKAVTTGTSIMTMGYCDAQNVQSSCTHASASLSTIAVGSESTVLDPSPSACAADASAVTSAAALAA